MDEPTRICRPAVNRLEDGEAFAEPSARSCRRRNRRRIRHARNSRAAARPGSGRRPSRPASRPWCRACPTGSRRARRCRARCRQCRRTAIGVSVDIEKFRLAHASSHIARDAFGTWEMARKVPCEHRPGRPAAKRVDSGDLFFAPMLLTRRAPPRHRRCPHKTPNVNGLRRRRPFADHSRQPRPPRTARAPTPTSGSPASSSSAQTAETSAKFQSTTHCCSPKRPDWTSWKSPPTQIRRSPRSSTSAS